MNMSQHYFNGMLTYIPGFICHSKIEKISELICQESSWQRPQLKLFGREIDVPRLVAYHGDSDAGYVYSGVMNTPSPWTLTLTYLRNKVADYCMVDFNSVLLNKYRDGADSMGWHSDDEASLGASPTIASISLGWTRKFRMHHKFEKKLRFEMPLESGSLLVMSPPCQSDWKHSVPQQKNVGARINLTFRQILQDSQGS